MDPVLAYAHEAATDDVRDTLTWLDRAGFQLTYSAGGSQDAFCDAMLFFRGPPDVKVVRDRGQWDIALRPKGDAGYYGLAVLLAARDGSDWEPAVADGPDLPAQLPPGVAWQEAVPAVIEWLGQPDSLAVARLAQARASQVKRQRLPGQTQRQ